MNTPIADAIVQYKAGTGSDPAPAPAGKPRSNPQIVKSLLNDFLWVNGCNSPTWPDFAERAIKIGLDVSEVTPAMIETAKKAYAVRLREQMATREVSSLPPGTEFRMMKGGSIMGGKILNSTETQSQVEVEREGGGKTVEPWPSATPVIPIKNKSDNLTSDGGESDSSNDGRSTVKLSEKTAREVLAAAGLPGVDGWSVKKLTRKINELDDLVEDGASEPSDAELNKVYHETIQALKAGGDVEIEEESESDIKELAKEVESTSNGKPTKEKQVNKSSKSGKVSDLSEIKFRPDGIPAKINAAIGRGFRPFEEVAKNAGVDVGRVRTHVRYWIGKGIPFVVEDNKVALKK